MVGANRIARALGLPLCPEVPTTATCPKCGYRWREGITRSDTITYYCGQCSRQGRGVVAMHLSPVEESQ